MKLEEEAVVLCDAATKRFDQLGRRRLDAVVDKRDQLRGVVFSLDDRTEDRTTTLAHDVREDRSNLYVRILEDLVDSLYVAGFLADQLLAGSRQRT